MRRGVAELPLHWGTAPKWLFQRMSRLCRAIGEVVVTEYGPAELLRRVSDPVWFQSLGCVAGFDWHSSGVTTTVCGALKDGLAGQEQVLGVYVCGGKGRASRRTPDEIAGHAQVFSLDAGSLARASRLVAKVDSAGLQDGYQIYHHVFFGTRSGEWAVVQQGMNEETRLARRYHWLSEGMESFVSEPHKGIACDRKGEALNMVAQEAGAARTASVELCREKPYKVLAELDRVKRLKLPEHHPVMPSDIGRGHFTKVLVSTYENPPADFAGLLLQPGVGPMTVRALAMIAEVTHGAALSFRDPAMYSFAVGGKDGFPYPVNRQVYDKSVAVMERAITEAKLGRQEQSSALRRLARWSSQVLGA